ncbi:hypothetical protein [Burkholderia ambifaria]|uniref:hypothetical protein n=1 Tax=Burkholderia ambifaria TaxID=152480 RepID=UPI001588A841|nr:hypothetical protein [Burkholderia ambifaria]
MPTLTSARLHDGSCGNQNIEPIIDGSEPPKTAEVVSKGFLGLFENMPFDREFEKLDDITKHVVDNISVITKIN